MPAVRAGDWYTDTVNRLNLWGLFAAYERYLAGETGLGRGRLAWHRQRPDGRGTGDGKRHVGFTARLG